MPCSESHPLDPLNQIPSTSKLDRDIWLSDRRLRESLCRSPLEPRNDPMTLLHSRIRLRALERSMRETRLEPFEESAGFLLPQFSDVGEQTVSAK